jgi:hypothetical protein
VAPNLGMLSALIQFPMTSLQSRPLGDRLGIELWFRKKEKNNNNYLQVDSLALITRGLLLSLGPLFEHDSLTRIPVSWL